MITIFLEGKLDELFIASILMKIGYAQSQFKINKLGGSDTALLIKRVTELKASSDKGWKNKVILDANGAPERRRADFNEFINGNGISAELYLCPDNGSNGMIEDLLEKIIPKDKLSILDCFQAYTDCIIKSGFNKPFSKSKIYAYAEATSLVKNELVINFGNPELWNLENASLDGLKSFLTS